MSTATLSRPTETAAPSAPGAPVASPPRASVLAPYFGYVGYFVGAGLISGGIVHYPLDPVRYGKIALAGAVVFVGATVLNEIVLPRTRLAGAAMARLVIASLLLSLGVGMLSGGIQHFLDFPARSAVLIPAGLALSFVAYTVKNATDVLDVIASAGGAAVGLLAFVALVALQHIAVGLESSGGSGHQHGPPASKPAATTSQHGEAGDRKGAGAKSKHEDGAAGRGDHSDH